MGFSLLGGLGCGALAESGPIEVDIEVVPEGVPESFTSAWLTFGLVDLTPCPHARWSPVDALFPSAHAHAGGPPPPTGTDVDRSVFVHDGVPTVVDTFAPTSDLHCEVLVELRPADDRGKEATTATWMAGEIAVSTVRPVELVAPIELLIDDDHREAVIRLHIDLSDWASAETSTDPAAALDRALVEGTTIEVHGR
jgi:hypothetical protein